jgi:hypothetical protein
MSRLPRTPTAAAVPVVASVAAPAPPSADEQSPFQQLVSEREVAGAQWQNESFVAECMETRHPTLTGRVQIRWEEGAGREQTLWVPVLRHLSVRVHDRVLVIRPRGYPEPLIVGVIDGFTRRPEPPEEVAARIEVRRDEKLQIVAENGAPLLEVAQNESGPVVRVLNATTQLELPGNLQITADEIVLRARQGKVEIDANDDVVVTGENIHLN